VEDCGGVASARVAHAAGRGPGTAGWSIEFGAGEGRLRGYGLLFPPETSMLPLASHAGVFLTRGRYIAGRRELPGGRIVQLGLVDADAIDALSACKQNLSGTQHD